MCLVCGVLGLAECSGAPFDRCRRLAALRFGLHTRAHPRAPRVPGARRVAVLDFAVRTDASRDLRFRRKREDQEKKDENSHRIDCSYGALSSAARFAQAFERRAGMPELTRPEPRDDLARGTEIGLGTATRRECDRALRDSLRRSCCSQTS